METSTLNIRSMTCNGCVASVTRVLTALGGVGGVEVSLAAGHATARFDPSPIDVGRLDSAVRAAGFETP